MKRKLIAAVLTLLLLVGGCAQAAELLPLTPMEQFVMKGKDGLLLLSMGEIDLALETFAFAFDVESGQTEETFREFVPMMTMLDELNLQLDVALCWMDELGVWHLGIPLVEPISWDVEALILDSRDMNIFCGYSLSTWGALEEAGMMYSEAYWNGEYLPVLPVLLADE